MILPRLLLAALLSCAMPVLAETPAQPPVAEATVGALDEAMQMDALFAVLRDEGLQHGRDLATDTFPNGAGAGWEAELQRIYAPGPMRARFDAAMERALGQDHEALATITGFFASDLGQRVVAGEIEARRAFLDTAAEEAARVAADDAATAKDPKVALIRRMIEACDLLEMNVAGSLTGNLAFVQGMADSGAYGAPVPPDQLLSDTWGQEEQTRSDLQTWLYSYLGLAYSNLSEADLTRYVEFWESPAGQKLNAALFQAFDEVFRPLSRDLGRAAGRQMQGRDI